MADTPLLSVLVPAYNEGQTVEAVLRRILALEGIELEIVLVDDGSQDDTAAIAERVAAEDSRVRVFHQPKNRGKTAAIRRAVEEARGDVLIVQDADLEYDPAEIPFVIQPILEGNADVVYGSRFLVRRAARVHFFWHYLAKMKAGGMRQLVSVEDAAIALGLDPNTPLLGYVMKEEAMARNPGLADSLAAASRDAKELLATAEEAWARLEPLMKAANEAEFDALVAGWQAGIPTPGPVDEVAANRMLALMAELGGNELLGPVKSLPDGVFHKPGS